MPKEPAVTTLSTALLLYFNQNRRSLEATWKYLMIGSVGIALALLGTLFLAYSALIGLGEPTLLFNDLVAFYKDKVDNKYEDLHERLAGMAVDAADLLRDHIEDDIAAKADGRDTKLRPGMLMEIVKAAADRTGHGPTSTNIQVNTGLAQRLEAARRRVTMIDVTPQRKDEAA